MPGDFAAIEARRAARSGPSTNDPTIGRRPMPTAKAPRYAYRSHGVVKVNDDGRVTVLRANMGVEQAEQAAGRLRDELSDADVGAGWNVVAKRVKQGHAGFQDWSVRDSKTNGRPGVPRPKARRK